MSGMCNRLVSQPALGRSALRPTSYRVATDAGAWSIALRRLHANGYSDSDIAYYLSRLSPHAILTLEAMAAWNRHDIEDYSMSGAGGYPWSKRAVLYHRQRLGLGPAKPPTPQQSDTSFTAGKRQGVRRRLYQQSQGWFHLLPAYDEQEGHFEGMHYDLERGYCRGLELRPVEVKILTTLWRHGEQPAKDIAKRLGRTTLRHPKESYLARLHDAALIQRRGWKPPLWSLVPGLHPDIREVTVDAHVDIATALLEIRDAEEVVHT